MRSWILATAAWLAAPAAASDSNFCFFYENETDIPVVHLDADGIDSVGVMLSDRNMALVDRIEAAYREGRYGKPGEKDSRKNAQAAFIYNAETAFDFFLQIATQEKVIYSTSEDDLKEAFTRRFRNPGLYPIVNLRDARAGFGRFCMKFEVERDEKREIEVAAEKMRAWTETIRIGDSERRVVNIDMKTMSHDRVHVVYEEHSCGSIRTFETEAGGQPVRVVSMEEIEGQYVRKWGFHQPTAIVLWRSAAADIESPPAGRRFLGSAIYFPSLTLQLPWFLPDIGFDDLRRFDFPEPLLTMDAFEELRRRQLDWLEVKDKYRFATWEGEGDVPRFVSERFPDL